MSSKQPLPGKRGKFFWVPPEDLTIVTDRTHPLWDERATLPLDRDFICSILCLGVKHPIEVVKEDDKILVISGRQRVRAACVANKTLAEGEQLRVPCILRRGDAGRLAGLMILENSARVNDPPIVSAQKPQRYLDRGRSLSEAQLYFGKSHRCLKNWLALLELPDETQKDIAAGKVSANKATKKAKPKKKKGKKDKRACRSEMKQIMNHPDVHPVVRTTLMWAMGLAKTIVWRKS